MKKLVQLLAIVFISFSMTAQTGIPVPEMTACDTDIQNFMNTFNIPSLTMALAKNGELKYMRSFGNADIALTTPTQPYNMFRIASISKPITSIGIMKMMENGQLNMNDKVFGPGGILENHWYFSNSSIIDNRVYDITVQMLLEHAAGWDRNEDCFPNPTTPYPWFFSGCDPIVVPLHITESQGESNPVKEEHLINYLLEKNLDFEPNSQYTYSNMGFLVLSEIIEEISGLSYEDYMQQEIFNPIGIYDMHIGENLLADKKEREGEYVGNGYTTLDLYGSGNLVPWEYGGFSVNAMDGHGGWIATARDMVRLLVAVDGFNTKPDILLPATINTMVSPSANNNNYAKGWGVNGANNWWHTGGLDGTASLFVRTNDEYTWAILINYREIGANANAFWTKINTLGFDCISSTANFPAWDLMDSPTVNASSLTHIGDGTSTMELSWDNGNGTDRVVVMKDITNNSAPYNFSTYPLDGTDYTSNSTFGTGDDLGDNTFIVYNGTGNTVTVTNLDPTKLYAIRVYEYTKNSNNDDNALYLLGNAAEKEATLSTENNTLSELISLYPTITSETLNIELSESLNNVDYYIYDLQGRTLQNGKLNGKTNVIDVSNFASGLYLLMAEKGQNQTVFRFIKK